MSNYVLGSTGFIGKAIANSLPDIQGIDKDSMKDFSVGARLFDVDSTVINCLSSRAHSTETGIKWANFELPKQIFRYQYERVSTWTQFSSYYSEYKTQYGIEMNSYSKWKNEFSHFLASQEKKTIVDFVLPHVFDPSENNNRIIKAIVFRSQSNRNVFIESIQQEIPIQRLKRVVSDFLHIKNSLVTNVYTRMKFPALMVTNPTELFSAFERVSGKKVNFSVRKSRERRVFSKLEWPIEVSGSKARIRELEKIFEEYLNAEH